MTIWKYWIPARDGTQTIPLPEGAEIVHVGEQNGQPHIWVRLEPMNPPEFRRFRIAGTGHEIPADLIYCGAAMCGPFVWHVLEEVRV